MIPFGFEIAMVDVEKNDIDFKLSGYPTMYYFDKEGKGIKYNSPRSIVSMRNFVTAHSTIVREYFDMQREAAQKMHKASEL